MGIGGISLSQLIIVLFIVALIFGTKKLRSLGTDLGHGLKSFRQAVKDTEEGVQPNSKTTDQTSESSSKPQQTPPSNP